MSDAVVRFSNVSKRFRLGETHDSLRDLLAGGIAWMVGRRFERNGRSSFWALRNVNFNVARGEPIGIIGPNGAGKSTVLKLLAGILRPDGGEIHVDGRLAALIEVGAGFHGDLSGRENIYLNGAILGMTRQDIRRKLDAIVDFAGIERFIDMPVKRYSSGMGARLGFAIAAHVDPEVLLVDEVLSVGDAVFRLRCMERMRELVAGGTTLVLVTHNLDQMRSICRRALVLEGGRCAFEGPPHDAVAQYLGAMSRTYPARSADVTADGTARGAAVELMGLALLNDADEEAVWIRPREPVRAVLTFRLHRPVHSLVVELNLRASASENVLSFNSGRDGSMFDAAVGVHTVTLALPRIPLAGGHYFWNVRIWDAMTGEILLDTPLRFPMVIDDEGRATGLMTLDHEWSFAPPASEPAALPEEEAGTRATVAAGEDRENLLLC
jgi:ABC-type polysaccharide/polyol phosphate transport system ATPase subunit